MMIKDKARPIADQKHHPQKRKHHAAYCIKEFHHE